MRLLLDTHALLWWTGGNERFPKPLRPILLDKTNEVMVSAVSAMEITTKFRLGKLPEGERLASNFAGELAAERFTQLPITVAHAALAGSLATTHKDPFDRLLIAQARVEDLTLVSNERLFDTMSVRRMWE